MERTHTILITGAGSGMGRGLCVELAGLGHRICVTDQNFEEEVLNSSQPVLVDFWAQWCAPCRMLAPTIDQIAEEFSGRAKVVKLNVDDNMGTSSKYNIRGIPTLLLFKDGEIKDQGVGSASGANSSRMSEAQLQQTAGQLVVSPTLQCPRQ